MYVLNSTSRNSTESFPNIGKTNKFLRPELCQDIPEKPRDGLESEMMYNKKIAKIMERSLWIVHDRGRSIVLHVIFGNGLGEHAYEEFIYRNTKRADFEMNRSIRRCF